MLLSALRLHGYRRFRDDTTLRTPSRVMALLGPNEVGKSSILNAVLHLRNDHAVPKSDLSHDTHASQHPPIIAEFRLEAEDRTELSDIPEIEQVRRFVVTKGRDGARVFSTIPSVVRDVRLLRASALQALTSLSPSEMGAHERALISLVGPDIVESPITRKKLKAHWGEISGLPHAANLQPLQTLIDEYQKPDPAQLIIDRLQQRLPNITLFGDDDRRLEAQYDIPSLSKAVPAALQNILSLAGLSPGALIAAVANGDTQAVRKLELKANNAMRDAFASKWSQAPLFLECDVSGSTLHFHVRDVTDDNYVTPLAERSAGFRQFIALMAIVLKRPADRPILLIDELEARLHYDAQADLVRLLERDRYVRQVIYTTHSMGCLPHDLGTCVAGVAAQPKHWSRVNNNFWHTGHGSGGFGAEPLLLAMGASSLAFVPLRSAVLVEGLSDAVLLPHLLRASAGVDVLPFQLLPGLSFVGNQELAGLPLSARRVSYVVDGDEAGEKRASQLKACNIDSSHVHKLPGRTLEDCVTLKAYVEAVNECLRAEKVSVAELDSKVPRPTAVQHACNRLGVTAPSKVAVAYALLGAVAADEDIVEPTHRAGLAKLAELLEAQLKI